LKSLDAAKRSALQAISTAPFFSAAVAPAQAGLLH
jgi:hypothetical protein